MTVLDSRRLTGPGLLLDGPGAVLDVQVDEAERERAIAGWRSALESMLEAVGWAGSRLAVRTFPGGASLALSAEPDVLYAATEINDWAWGASRATVAGNAPPDFEQAAERLRASIAAERNPRLLALRDAARHHGVRFLSDEEWVSVGSGSGVRVWPTAALPAPEEVEWPGVHDIPVALVTGSNGKTTVVRLLSAMVEAAGRVPGYTSTDGVALGGVIFAPTDFSGPSGARMLLRRVEVETAILETARGGILRRGLAVERAQVAVVTNVAADHLGEFGVQDLRELAETKLLVAGAVVPGGRVVLNADDPVLVAAAAKLTVPIAWFTLDPASPTVAAHLAAGGTAVLATPEEIVIAEGGARTALVPLAEVALALGGAARHNVANALAAVGAATGLGLPVEAMRLALRRFGREPGDNPGRANLLDVGGVKILIDYAHNPHGMAALARVTSQLPARRRLLLLGQAGDRSDDDIRELARAAMAIRPDRVVVKEIDQYLRGRAPGEVPALIASELERLGIPGEAISQPGAEVPAVREALAWARRGDLLIFALHQDRAPVLALLDSARAQGWSAGEALPV